MPAVIILLMAALVVWGVYMLLAWLGVVVLTITEFLFTAWPLPVLGSWAVSGFVLGSFLHFAVVEYRRLPNAATSVLWKGIAILAVLVATAIAIVAGILAS